MSEGADSPWSIAARRTPGVLGTRVLEIAIAAQVALDARPGGLGDLAGPRAAAQPVRPEMRSELRRGQRHGL
ncbi:hypothetical protein [Nonomuraea dietziae]|uniref:hypothetical protein n=1 Tax=Nonomuraea dietziae TaxID=65515 RepID=UPI0031D3F53A